MNTTNQGLPIYTSTAKYSKIQNTAHRIKAGFVSIFDMATVGILKERPPKGTIERVAYNLFFKKQTVDPIDLK